MARRDLPQQDGSLYLTDGGIETTLIFHRGLELPLFAAFTLLGDERGTAAVRDYFLPYLELAVEHDTGFVLESPTWRASPRWAEELGYSEAELEQLNRRAIELLGELRSEYSSRLGRPIVISGCIGPQDDGYDPAQILTAGEAEDYHAVQIRTFAGAEADLVTAITMTYAEEATGIARAAEAAGIAAVISFTVETNGRLPSGQPLGEAIDHVEAETGSSPAYYMLNCAHPTHLEHVLEPNAAWAGRVRGLRANASTMSHAELDEATELDRGDPHDLGSRYADLVECLPNLNVLGGCCGTDDEHVAAIAAAVTGPGEKPTAG